MTDAGAPTFGPWTIDRRLRSDPASAAFLATRNDGPAAELRIFDAGAARAGPGRRAALDALEAAWQQADLCAAGASAWAPILDFGATGGAPFIATEPCDLTAEELIRARATGDERRLWGVIAGVLDGLIEIESLAGRPHGALTPGAIRLTLRLRDGAAPAQLADCAPASSVRPRRDRAADIRAVGELIVRLATGMEPATLGGWPLPPAAGWRRLRNGDGWRTLANTLLDPAADTGVGALREARARIDRLKPASPRRRLAVAGAVGLVAIVSAAILLSSPWREVRGKPANLDQLVELIEMNRDWSGDIAGQPVSDIPALFRSALAPVASAPAEKFSALRILEAAKSGARPSDLLNLPGAHATPTESLSEADRARLLQAERWLRNDRAAIELGAAYTALSTARRQTLDAITTDVARVAALPHSLPADTGLLPLLPAAVEWSMTSDIPLLETLKATSRALADLSALSRTRAAYEPHRPALEQDDLLAPSLAAVGDDLEGLGADAEALRQQSAEAGAPSPGELAALLVAARSALASISDTAAKLEIIAGAVHEQRAIHRPTFDQFHRTELEPLPPAERLARYAELVADPQSPSRIPAQADPRLASRARFDASSARISELVRELHELGNTDDAADYERRLHELTPPDAGSAAPDAPDSPWNLPWVNLRRSAIEAECAALAAATDALDATVDESVAEATGDRETEIASLQDITLAELLAPPVEASWLPADAAPIDSPAIEAAWSALRDQVIAEEPRGVYGLRRGIGAAAHALVALDAALPHDPAIADAPGVDGAAATTILQARRERAMALAAAALRYRKDEGRTVPFSPAESAPVGDYTQWRKAATAALQRASAVYLAITALGDLTDRAPDPVEDAAPSSTPGPTIADLWRRAQDSPAWGDVADAAGQTAALVDALAALPSPDGGGAGLAEALRIAADPARPPPIAVAAWRRAVPALERLQLGDLDLMLTAYDRARALAAAHAPQRLTEFAATWAPACSLAWENCLETAADAEQIAIALGAAPRLFDPVPAHDSQQFTRLSARSRFNLLLSALKADASLQALRALETQPAQDRLSEFLDVADDLGASEATLLPLRDMLQESLDNPDGSIGFQTDALGPEAEWLGALRAVRVDDRADPEVRRFEMPWGETLTFRGVEPGGEEPPAFLCTTETSTETFVNILRAVAADLDGAAGLEQWFASFQSDRVPDPETPRTTWRVRGDQVVAAQDDHLGWTWVNVEHPDVANLVTEPREPEFYAERRIERRSERHPVNMVSQTLALGVASRIGCRLPTPAEVAAALKLPRAPGAPDNLRDQRFAMQRDLVERLRRELIDDAREPALAFPDEAVVWPGGVPAQRPQLATAIVADDAPDDGSIYPRPVPHLAPAETRFFDLVGNVAEWVCGVTSERSADGVIHPPAGPLSGAAARDLITAARKASDASGVMGRSALSCPRHVPDAETVYRVAQALRGYADVGFRLAFTGGPTRLGEAFASQIRRFEYIGPPP